MPQYNHLFTFLNLRTAVYSFTAVTSLAILGPSYLRHLCQRMYSAVTAVLFHPVNDYHILNFIRQ